ncbi:MAG: GNAT family N-acetyltransferase [Acidobacteriota bacterium]|nr:GNAT family N-acetyltransferase [Acidobacteriota bacterium]
MPVHTAQDVQVRRLRDADQPLLGELYATFAPFGDALGLPPHAAERRQAWLRSLRNGLNLVAEVEGKLAGHLALLAVDESAAELMCFVHQDFRRHGIATALCCVALDQAKAAGYQRISVFINTHNRAARHGLLKFGFEPVWEDLEEAEYVYWLWGREA